MSPLKSLAPLAVLALALPALAQPAPYTDSREIPDTPAYQAALQVAEAINSGDPKTVLQLLDRCTPDFRAIAPDEEHQQMFARMKRMSGRMEPYAARTYDPPRPENEAVLIVRNTLTQAWGGILVTVEEAEPHRIASIDFAPARPPSDAPPAERLSDEQMAADLQAMVERMAASEAFAGAVLLARNGEVLYSGAFGEANRDFGAPNTLDTKFNLGSMNKMFTAVAVLRLEEAGKLSLDDPISEYLDASWLPKDVAATITVRHLLTHTSGLGSYFTDEFFEASRDRFREVGDYRELIQDDRPRFEPGTDWSYSNSGFMLAGAVIEAASGQDYFDFMRAEVYARAGMGSTDCYDLDEVNPNLAVGYIPEPGSEGVTWKNNVFMHVIRGGPAGGGYSTVQDLLRFDQALRSGALLAPESLEKLWKAYPELSSPGYGLGFSVDASAAGRRVGHSGGFPGLNGDLTMYLDEGYTIAVLSNIDGGAMPIAQRARALIEQGR